MTYPQRNTLLDLAAAQGWAAKPGSMPSNVQIEFPNGRIREFSNYGDACQYLRGFETITMMAFPHMKGMAHSPPSIPMRTITRQIGEVLHELDQTGFRNPLMNEDIF